MSYTSYEMDCLHEECSKKATVSGYCKKHYKMINPELRAMAAFVVSPDDGLYEFEDPSSEYEPEDIEKVCNKFVTQFKKDNPSLVKAFGELSSTAKSWVIDHRNVPLAGKTKQLNELAKLPPITKDIIVYRGQHEPRDEDYDEGGISTTFVSSIAVSFFGHHMYKIYVPAGSVVLPTFLIDDNECEITLLPRSLFKQIKKHGPLNSVTLTELSYKDPVYVSSASKR